MKNFLVSLFLVLACAAPAVFAKPPPALMHVIVSTSDVVHDKKCDVASLQIKEQECLITYNEKDEIVYIILFDGKLEIERIIAVHNQKETFLWCRPTVCL